VKYIALIVETIVAPKYSQNTFTPCLRKLAIPLKVLSICLSKDL
jgi:hypothetical protein